MGLRGIGLSGFVGFLSGIYIQRVLREPFYAIRKSINAKNSQFDVCTYAYLLNFSFIDGISKGERQWVEASRWTNQAKLWLRDDPSTFRLLDATIYLVCLSKVQLLVLVESCYICLSIRPWTSNFWHLWLPSCYYAQAVPTRPICAANAPRFR